MCRHVHPVITRTSLTRPLKNITLAKRTGRADVPCIFTGFRFQNFSSPENSERQYRSLCVCISTSLEKNGLRYVLMCTCIKFAVEFVFRLIFWNFYRFHRLPTVSWCGYERCSRSKFRRYFFKYSWVSNQLHACCIWEYSIVYTSRLIKALTKPSYRSAYPSFPTPVHNGYSK